jgi:Tc5 transposase DNA-binding domain/CENP-B N-terminal DNA-binding domain
MNQKRKNVNDNVISKKRKVLSFKEKKDLCLLRQENPSLSQEEIGMKFGIKKNTVCDILKNKEKWLNIELTSSNSAKQKQESAKFPELEEALAIWVSKALAANKTITGEIIIAKAINFANLMNIEGFTGSSGWLSNFKKRHNIKQYNKHGEAQSGLSEEELDKEKEKLRELISNYDIEDVFNCDETGINFTELINIIILYL